jgi:hypothetical protein
MILLALLLVFVNGADAQPSGLDDDPGTTVPMDGGLSLLLGAGICYGAKRLKVRHTGQRFQFKDRPMP